MSVVYTFKTAELASEMSLEFVFSLGSYGGKVYADLIEFRSLVVE